MNKKIKIKKLALKTRPKLSEVQNLKCDNRKIKKYTNWKPTVNLETGLKETIKWVRQNISYFKDTYSL